MLLLLVKFLCVLFLTCHPLPMQMQILKKDTYKAWSELVASLIPSLVGCCLIKLRRNMSTQKRQNMSNAF